jgi:trehalose 6-phosphate synthase/phosphatase
MDSFSEPYTRADDDISLDEVRAQVRALEDDHRAKGIDLSGRVLHVCHYLPVTSTLASRAGVPSPPATPPLNVSNVLADSTFTEKNRLVTEIQPPWTLTPRYGHAAMISGIRSLSATHEQLIIGWTGDIETTTPGERVTTSSISQADKDSLEEALATYTPREADPDDDKKTHYVPVWQDDKIAHGHYDGYCKTSEFIAKVWTSTPRRRFGTIDA